MSGLGVTWVPLPADFAESAGRDQITGRVRVGLSNPVLSLTKQRGPYSLLPSSRGSGQFNKITQRIRQLVVIFCSRNSNFHGAKLTAYPL